MKALVFDGELRIKDVPEPKVPDGEALVRVTMAGICNTDVEICKGYMNFRGIPGHEFVGIVEKSPVAEQVGTRVVGEINAGCGECTACRQGLERHCAQRSVLGILNRNGAFAEYLTLPPLNLVEVPESLSDEATVFTEPLAAAVEILEQVHIRPADRVMVVGDGKLGLMIGMVLRLTGCDLLLVGKHPEKLDVLERVGGSTMTLEALAERTDVFDVVVEASGKPSGWGLAMSRVKPRGVLILKSTYHGSLDFNTAPIVVNEVTVVGSRCGRFEPALRLLARNLVDPAPLVHDRLPFRDGEEAFRLAQQPGVCKVLLKF
jgi:alcohol dehydrogenase